MGGIQPLLIAQESGRTQCMHEMIEFRALASLSDLNPSSYPPLYTSVALAAISHSSQNKYCILSLGIIYLFFNTCRSRDLD